MGKKYFKFDGQNFRGNLGLQKYKKYKLHCYNFIKRWFNETGVPIVLNTSFNDREPIVETPENAIECFLKTKIDYLYFPEYNILAKKK